MKSIKMHLHPFPCLLLLLLNLPLQSQADCDCAADTEPRGKSSPLPLKLIALASILTAGAMGVLIPILGRSISVLQPEHDMFFVIKAFAAGVILATGLIHILPDGYERLTSPCLGGDPKSRFPFAGFIAMLSAMGTMMVDALATGFYRRSSNLSKAQPVEEDDEMAEQSDHAHHAHSHGSSIVVSLDASLSERIRQRVISQVLELGILGHSVIIGLSLGASQRSSTIRPLVGALSFHQFFEGIGLGGCIVQANFKARATVIMAIFFSLTAPLGIAVGIGISSGYDANSSTALILEGVLNSASAGILIYMSLVNLLAADFLNPRMQSNVRLQLGANVALILGSGCMSILAKWA